MNNFQTYCYSNPEQRKKLVEIVEFTASILMKSFWMIFSSQTANAISASKQKE